MEVFSACLKKSTATSDFSYHWRTKEAGLHHVIFADDMFMFSKADIPSVTALMIGVSNFSSMSGLVANYEKSKCFFANVHGEVLRDILLMTRFSVGRLPICYQGLPLITGKLSPRDCEPLVRKMCFNIASWTAKFLNFGGRLQFISSILSRVVGYWCMFLFLPRSVIKRLNNFMAKFLWGGFQKDSGKCLHKVSWASCCRKKSEGGLGLKNLVEWNRASIFFQLWRILQPNSKSLWVN